MIKIKRKYKFVAEIKRMGVRPLPTRKRMQNQWDKLKYKWCEMRGIVGVVI